jgi:hypothetical protein
MAAGIAGRIYHQLEDDYTTPQESNPSVATLSQTSGN